MEKQKINLAKLILTDLLTVGRIPLLLMCFILATAVAIVFVTYNTRVAITTKDGVLQQREYLDIEWRNAILEETTLSEHSNVQDIAQRELNMNRPDGDKEIVISIK